MSVNDPARERKRKYKVRRVRGILYVLRNYIYRNLSA